MSKKIIFVLFVTLLATPVVAQEYTPVPRGHDGRNFTPIPHHLHPTQMEMMEHGGTAESKEALDARAERDRLAACERMEAEMLAPEQIAFGHWGYRHNEAHCREWVRQLQESAGVSCCSSPYSGECRVSRMDFVTKLFEIDGMMCPINKDTKKGVIDAIGVSLVLVCASRPIANASGERECPTIHCIGRPAGM